MITKDEKIKVINQAYEIAVVDLRSNYGKLGIYAGPRNHHEYWARDSFFASLGSLAIGDLEIVKKNLDHFTKYQSVLGHIPLRIEERYHGPAVVGITISHSKPRALYKTSQPWAGTVIDSNPLFLIACSNYVLTSGDKTWMQKNEKAIMNAVAWLVGRFNELDLVTEGYNAGWADFTFKRGNVLYTNILVWKAFDLLCKALPTDGANYCIALTKRLETSIRKHFWYEKGGYFIDHFGLHKKKHRVFASDGNLLAILLDYATHYESKKILKFIDTYHQSRIPVPIYFKGLEWKHKVLNHIIFPEYNTDFTFLWWGNIAAACQLKTGWKKSAFKTFYRIAKVIVKYGFVPEIVTEKGRLVNSWYYKSEKRAAWSAGTFVYAYSLARKTSLL